MFLVAVDGKFPSYFVERERGGRRAPVVAANMHVFVVAAARFARDSFPTDYRSGVRRRPLRCRSHSFSLLRLHGAQVCASYLHLYMRAPLSAIHRENFLIA